MLVITFQREAYSMKNSSNSVGLSSFDKIKRERGFWNTEYEILNMTEKKMNQYYIDIKIVGSARVGVFWRRQPTWDQLLNFKYFLFSKKEGKHQRMQKFYTIFVRKVVIVQPTCVRVQSKTENLTTVGTNSFEHNIFPQRDSLFDATL